jgi:hypothetical protein
MTKEHIYLIIKDGEIYAFASGNTLEQAVDSMDAVGADQVLRIDRKTIERLHVLINEDLKADSDCPHCGSREVWRNSSGELQCDNCGHEDHD